MSIQVLLNDRIANIIKNNPDVEKSEKDYFEFAVANILNIKYLSGIDFEDLLDGIVGSGGDEGIDCCYALINDKLIKDFDSSQINKASTVRLEIIQAKKTSGFSANEYSKLCEGIEEIFTLDKKTFKKIGANTDLIEKANLFRNIFADAMKKAAIFKLRIHFVTIGDKNKIPSKILHLERKLRRTISWVKNISFEYFGAQELFDLSQEKEEQISLTFADQPLELSDNVPGIEGFAGFVKGKLLIKSLLDENDRFKEELTEGNIRFFLGEDITINNSIIETAISNVKSKSFWAMNNGITIIGDSIRSGGKNIKIIDNPQIVNGCQTVHCLYEAYKRKGNSLSEELQVFVKLIQTINFDIQQDIISATNSQNKVSTASLKANDKIQKNIEAALVKNDIYYERRKNFYKRKGRSGLQVISIEKMAQIMHTIYQKEAIRAVNHTKDLFENDDLYMKIFNINADYDAYLYAVLLYQKLWSMKSTDIRTNKKIYDAEKKELISKSLFCLLHIASTIMIQHVYPLDISMPRRKNIFSQKSKGLFKQFQDNNTMDKLYDEAKKIFLSCTEKYHKNTKKVKNTLFKNRSFDKEYLVPQLLKYLEGK